MKEKRCDVNMSLERLQSLMGQDRKGWESREMRAGKGNWEQLVKDLECQVGTTCRQAQEQALGAIVVLGD